MPSSMPRFLVKKTILKKEIERGRTRAVRSRNERRDRLREGKKVERKDEGETESPRTAKTLKTFVFPSDRKANFLPENWGTSTLSSRQRRNCIDYSRVVVISARF